VDDFGMFRVQRIALKHFHNTLRGYFSRQVMRLPVSVAKLSVQSQKQEAGF
jgi:hypothetical protein